MRALYTPDYNLQGDDSIQIENEAFHHFKNVLRIRKREEILFLDGAGLGRIYIIDDFDRRSITCSPTGALIEKKRKHGIDICLGQVKKEALDLIIKQCCELGIGKIYICQTEYSQDYPLKEDRLHRLVTAGIEQSNAFFRPEIIETNLDSSELAAYSQKYLFTLKQGAQATFKAGISGLVFIGPEGGFSTKEEVDILELGAQAIQLNTNIMRSTTATACAVGYLQGISH